MIYNFNLGIGWASSGVEYAQLYRARMFRGIGEPARFVFTDMFPQENIAHYTRNIGFEDEEVIWLYTFFTDFKIAPVTYTLADFLATLADRDYSVSRSGRIGRIVFTQKDNFCTLYYTSADSDRLHRVEYVSDGCLIRKDYFTYGRLYSEYYAPLDGKAHLYLRRFFNTDGSVAYEEMIDDDDVMYRFPDQLFYSKEALVGYMVRCLHLKADDTVIVDRTTGIGQAILQNCGPAQTGIVVHADHYSAGSTNADNVLWNNYYEYAFDMARHISFFVTSTDAQRNKMAVQFAQYVGQVPKIVTIPVGSLEKLREPDPQKGRRPYAIVTASRLATEKHIDWIIEACVAAKKDVPELTLDIYGAGGEYNALSQLIEEKEAGAYIRLMGQHDMTDLYQNYELYLSGSTSEGFGLSLMEAVGAGLPMIGFDVPYGNPTFIDDGRNGYLIPVDVHTTIQDHIEGLRDRVVHFFKTADRQAFQRRSYAIAEAYLTEKVMQRWKDVIR
ncbi:MAG: accessory Sec system glycosyltransferase GtfA [Eubacteriaceae bacterium]|uniref:UDP-N-acetylglucosamine--peptide N-acetylglucosaminyltransferase GtfA subunit n=1 Tax=Candidatus Pseudoramibacter fermentans TaxID=2594427 RepID=A0A6L5GPB9_9FIRM|nr:accessory Sec system glycosyltransferase GtfA [Candidatus Pseudoramibacter fermentans]RRF92472.1 MAG: accessory Sec system glycosyltransferase GtfA [Eubacteriaceae bacterium]